MKVAIYSTPAYLDATIQLVNELCNFAKVFMIIEYKGERMAGIWCQKDYKFDSLFITNPDEINKFLGKELSQIIDRRVKIAILNFLSIKATSPLRYLSTYLLLRYLEKIKVDVFDIHSLHAVLLLPILPVRGKVVTLHDPFLHPGEDPNWGYRVHIKIALRFADQVIFYSKKMKEYFKRVQHLFNEKITALNLGIYSGYLYWANPKIVEEEGAILFFGRITPYKGLGYLIKAESLIAQEIPNFKIIIAGAGDFSEYQKMIKEKRRYEIYNHYITNELAASLFQRATCVVLPYIDATQSGVLMTAYAFNKPVVVTEVGGLPEMVEDGKTGFVVPKCDETSLARAIIKLLKNSGLREGMKKKIIKKTEDEFSWRQIAYRTIEVYKRALGFSLANKMEI